MAHIAMAYVVMRSALCLLVVEQFDVGLPHRVLGQLGLRCELRRELVLVLFLVLACSAPNNSTLDT